MEQPVLTRRPSYRTAVVTFGIGLALGLTARELALSAHAQMDPGRQRIDMNQGISQLNDKMAEMLTLLRTGTLKVRVVGSDKTTGSAQSIRFEPAGPTGQNPPAKEELGAPAGSPADAPR